MIHYKDISYEESEEELKKYKKNDPITAKVLEHNQEKIRLGLKQLLPDPIDYFKDKKEEDIITVIVLETLDNGIKVKPDGCPMKILIKKNQIAINKEDQRTNRFNKGDKVDCMLLDLDLKKRKVSLSIKMLEEEQTKEAIKRYGSVDSGRSLPFAELPKTLKKKNETRRKIKLSFVKSQILDQLANSYPNFLRRDLEKALNLVLDEIIKAIAKGEKCSN